MHRRRAARRRRTLDRAGRPSRRAERPGLARLPHRRRRRKTRPGAAIPPRSVQPPARRHRAQTPRRRRAAGPGAGRDHRHHETRRRCRPLERGSAGPDAQRDRRRACRASGDISDAYTALDAPAVRQIYPTLAVRPVRPVAAKLRRDHRVRSGRRLSHAWRCETTRATVRALVVRRIAPKVGTRGDQRSRDRVPAASAQVIPQRHGVITGRQSTLRAESEAEALRRRNRSRSPGVMRSRSPASVNGNSRFADYQHRPPRAEAHAGGADIQVQVALLETPARSS